MTDRLTILKVIQESAGPSHYLVQFDCDECISIITRKQLLRPSVAVVNGECWINWNGEEYSAKVLAVGDQAAMKQAEADILNHLHANDQQSSDERETAPPPKRRRLGLKTKRQGAKKEKSKQSKRKQTRQAKQKSSTFQLEIGSPAKDSPGKGSPSKRSPAKGSPSKDLPGKGSPSKRSPAMGLSATSGLQVQVHVFRM